MLFDFTIIGFGVIGAETLHGIRKNLLKRNPRNKRKIRIALIEKNIKNIPGGVAYSQENSKFGYFNNPLRLSHPEFIKWFNLKENKKRIIDFSKMNPSYNLNNWLVKNESIIKEKYKNYKEIYLPRLIYSFYLKDKILHFLAFKKKMNISLKIYRGEAKEIGSDKYYNVIPNKVFDEFIIKSNKKNLVIKKHKLNKLETIKSKKLIIGIGVVPPKIIKETIVNKNFNYIWDFYSSGGTNNLINKINIISKIKKNISIIFIGNKAGLLETMQEIEKLIKNNKININIICISKSTQTLQKAERSKKFIFFKFKYLIKKNIYKIKKANKYFIYLKMNLKTLCQMALINMMFGQMFSRIKLCPHVIIG